MTMFFLGASAVMLATQAFDITTSLNNAVQYISQIFVTSDGTPSGTDGVFLDGTNGGKLGVGTNAVTPGAQVEITDSTGSILLGNVEVAGYAAPFMWLKSDRNTTTGGLQLGDWFGYFGFIKSLDKPLVFTTSGGVRYDVVIATGGNVGIGTAVPTEKLQIGTYAWIGNNNNDALSTGGTFLRLAGSHSLLSHGGGSLSANQPNLQLNYDLVGLSIYPNPVPHTYYNRKIDGGTTFGVSFATGTYDYQNKFTILPNGAVGINTTTPTCGGSSPNTCGLEVKQKDSYFDGDFSIMNGVAGIGYDTINAAGAGDLFVLNKIGINTSTPDCGDATNPYCGLMVNDRDTYLGSDVAMMNGDVGIGYNILTGSSTAGNLYVLNKIGIGTTTPDTTLTVSGAIRITTDIHVSARSSCTGKLGTIVFDNGLFYGCLLYSGNPEWHILSVNP
ncbi:MAG: hypothetical protein NTX91_04315 [candidate division SR1 bacterium]|nr:hypothetical protein [candidate division SR1 bacterium]